jgi:hypothetical protein
VSVTLVPCARRRGHGRLGNVFVTDEIVVPVESGRLWARLTSLAETGELGRASQAAYRHGTAQLRVGPLGDRAGLSKLVTVRFLAPLEHDGTPTLPLRWEATGPAGDLFPVLDANLIAVPEGAEKTRLTMTGAYRPPFGRLGATLDKAILNRVAHATVHALLCSLADALATAGRAS